MADFQTIIYEKVEDKIFRITLNRPEKINALSPQLLAEFEQATQALTTTPKPAC
jgi:1,4-dihydroxy-2-naphthoyl-CoA synthase